MQICEIYFSSKFNYNEIDIFKANCSRPQTALAVVRVQSVVRQTAITYEVAYASMLDTKSSNLGAPG